MKYPFFILLMLISLNGFGQSESEERLNFFKLQGGFVFDSGSSKDYAGFNYLNLGFSRLKNKRVEGLELELMAFDQIIERRLTVNGLPVPPSDWNCQRWSAELSAFRTFPLINDIKNGIFVGPYASLGFTATKINPVEGTSGFPLDLKCYCLGLGAKFDYYAQISEKIYLTFGVKINLINAGINHDSIMNPALSVPQQTNTSFDAGLLGGKIPLSFGVSFSI